MAKEKSQYYDAQKIQIIYDFLLKSHSDAQKYGKNMYLRREEGKNHADMMLTKYRYFMNFC